MIDDIHAVVYGGDQVDRGFTSEVRIFDLSRMVSGMLVHNIIGECNPSSHPYRQVWITLNMPPVMKVEPGDSAPCDGGGAVLPPVVWGGARGFDGF